MDYQEFPKWKYAVGLQLVVNSAEEEAALTGSWFDNQGDVPEGEDPDIKAEKDALLAQAADRGIPVDKRWSIAKIKEALA